MNLRLVRIFALFVSATLAPILTGAYAQTLGAGDIALRPARVAAVYGRWAQVADATGAGGSAVWHPDASAPKVTQALQSPTSYFEVTFNAEAGIPYRLWLRMRAQNNEFVNDSVFVQFDGAVDASSQPIFKIGTTSAAEINLEDCKGCGISNWGWQDNGWGTSVLGPAIYFGTNGPQVLRVQSREDGAIIDQILLSPSKYIASSPGTLKNDVTILPESATDVGPSVTLVRGPYLQQVTATAASVVWATREAGPAEVRYSAGGATKATAAVTRRVPASITGFGFDYHQHEARLTGLASSTPYTYQPVVAGANATPGATPFRTAPVSGSGAVTFIAFGDSGTGSTQQRQIASRISADTFDLALHGGDMVYGTATGTGDASYRTYQDWFFGIYQSWLGSRPLFPAQGNHDSRPSNNNGAAYLDLFSLPRNGASASYPDHAERYYSFDYGPMHFIALDTEFAFQDVTRRAEQIAWLDADLARTTQPWKVAFFHRSPYSAGAAKITTASASPANYFETTFDAQAGVPYRLWVRGKADRNFWANDSVYAQLSGSVSSTGAATYRIGTSAATQINMETAPIADCPDGDGRTPATVLACSARRSIFRPRGRSGFACRRGKTACRSIKSCCRPSGSSPRRPDR